MIDIGARQNEMNSIKQVPVSVAQALVKGGQTAIEGAILGSKQPWYKSDLPGETSRKNVQAHLQWHAFEIAKLAGTPNAMYKSGEDLKKYTMLAFQESNAVEEGAAYLDKAWTSMWSEIAAALAALPKEVAKKVGEVASGLLTGLMPVWGWALLGVGVLGTLIAGLYFGGRRR
jgi:hypothetical protein